jgi:hypothetical protein
MRKIQFALIGAAALALAACGSQEEDTLGENPTETIDGAELNALADNAALEAETEALGTQQQQLEAEPVANEAANATANGVVVEPSDVEDDVQGM